MTQVVEFEGKNIDQAIEKACEAARIPKEKLRYDVLSYGSTGIFGLVGSKKARIRVELPGSTEAGRKKKGANPNKPETLVEAETPRVNDSAEKPDPPAGSAGKAPATLGEEALGRILESITTDTQIDVESGPERILYNVKGGNSALLIGKRGQTLEAMQYLVEKIVNRNTEKRLRVRVDVEGYQKNRRISLERLAEKVSEKVKRTGRPATLGDMNASDRRIVHMALKDDHEVRTQSRGGGALKKLSIIPRKRQPSGT